MQNTFNTEEQLLQAETNRAVALILIKHGAYGSEQQGDFNCEHFTLYLGL